MGFTAVLPALFCPKLKIGVAVVLPFAVDAASNVKGFVAEREGYFVNLSHRNTPHRPIKGGKRGGVHLVDNTIRPSYLL